MSIQHREDSIRDMKLERLGVTPPQDWNDVEQVRTAKKAEIGLACSAAIYAGIDVGGAHYSLTEHDFYHRTYCNHLNAWIKRAGLDEIPAIVYGADLPADLAASMAALIEKAGGDA